MGYIDVSIIELEEALLYFCYFKFFFFSSVSGLQWVNFDLETDIVYIYPPVGKLYCNLCTQSLNYATCKNIC